MQIRNILYKSKITDPKAIPIIINNRNRYTTLKQLIDSLEKRGYHNIYIIDNNSSYPPLLEYYKNIKHKIFFLHKNIGYLALWKSGVYKNFNKDFYVYTDSDVVPIEECPDDFMRLFHDALIHNSDVQKAGFSLKIDDLPDYYLHKQDVVQWEKRHFEKSVSNLFYEAPIDTTFALYRPGAKGRASQLRNFRSKYPYEARHMPWYVDTNKIEAEEKYYIENSNTSTHWTKQNSKH